MEISDFTPLGGKKKRSFVFTKVIPFIYHKSKKLFNS